MFTRLRRIATRFDNFLEDRFGLKPLMVCGMCRNHVEHDANECPYCGVRFGN